VSLNRWVFKLRLKVIMFPHSRMSAGRSSRWMEQQQNKRDGPVQCVDARNDQQWSIGRAQSSRW